MLLSISLLSEMTIYILNFNQWKVNIVNITMCLIELLSNHSEQSFYTMASNAKKLMLINFKK